MIRNRNAENAQDRKRVCSLQNLSDGFIYMMYFCACLCLNVASSIGWTVEKCSLPPSNIQLFTPRTHKSKSDFNTEGEKVEMSKNLNQTENIQR